MTSTLGRSAFRTKWRLLGATALAGMVLVSGPAAGQDALPEHLVGDPVAEALGPEIMNAAIAEGVVVFYGGTGTEQKSEAVRAFTELYGIDVQLVTGELRNMSDRLRTEISVGRVNADLYETSDQYLFELHGLDALERWKPPVDTIDQMTLAPVEGDLAGYWWPIHVSAQGLQVNTNMVDPDEIRSYRDLLDPKYRGLIGTRDPRASGGGAWQMLGIYNTPSLGLDYIEELVEITEPVTVAGHIDAIRDAVIRGEFAIGFNARGSTFQDLPASVPLAWVVPEEGLSWLPQSVGILRDGPNPNAAKVMATWLFQLEQLQQWTDLAYPVPHPDIESAAPEMSLTDYPLMPRIPNEQLGDPNFFFRLMEDVFGIR